MKNPKIITAVEPIFVDIMTVTAITGLSKTTVQKLIRENKFPKARQASDNSARWLVREIREWAEQRPIANFLPPPNTDVGGRNGTPNKKKIDAIHEHFGASC